MDFPNNIAQLDATPHNMLQLLNNISSVYYADSSVLKSVVIVPGCVAANVDPDAFTALPLVGLASAETTAKISNKSVIYTATVNALLSSHFNADNRKLVFLIKTVSCDWFLVGSDDRHHPVVTVSDVMPSKMTEASGCNVVIEYTDLYGLLPVVLKF